MKRRRAEQLSTAGRTHTPLRLALPSWGEVAGLAGVSTRPARYPHLGVPPALTQGRAGKVDNRSSEFHPGHNHVRRDGSYIYEGFLRTGGTDVKVYTVGAVYPTREREALQLLA
jgi:hypothetical protein